MIKVNFSSTQSWDVECRFVCGRLLSYLHGLWILYCADDQIAQNIDFWEQIHE